MSTLHVHSGAVDGRKDSLKPWETIPNIVPPSLCEERLGSKVEASHWGQVCREGTEPWQLPSAMTLHRCYILIPRLGGPNFPRPSEELTL